VRVALEHGPDHADFTAEVRHARPVDRVRPNHAPLHERVGEGTGGRAPLEERLARDVVHVHEGRFVEAAEVDERHDANLRDRAPEGADNRADLVLLEVQRTALHGLLLER